MRKGYVGLVMVGVAAVAAVFALTTEMFAGVDLHSKSGENDFANFVTKFKKSYQTKEEYNYRMSLFKQRALEI